MMMERPPLVEAYPALADTWTPLMNGPSPVQHLSGLGAVMGRDDLWMKIDGLIGRHVGGSKVRNLEFLLGAAIRSGARSISALGAIQSNFALAVAIYGFLLNRKINLYLANVSQWPDARIADQVQMLQQLGADVDVVPQIECWLRNLDAHAGGFIRRLNGSSVAFPLGGASPLGCLGPMNAAFELVWQVSKGILPKPNIIVLPVGSGGMIAGLLAGLTLAGMPCHLFGVRVVGGPSVSRVARLARKTIEKVTGAAGRNRRLLPSVGISETYLPPGYGIPSEESQQNVQTLADLEGVLLDHSYAAKAMSAFMDLARNARAEGPILFWNTCSAVPRPEFNTAGQPIFDGANGGDGKLCTGRISVRA